jgi:hypothetical protein
MDDNDENVNQFEDISTIHQSNKHQAYRQRL